MTATLVSLLVSGCTSVDIPPGAATGTAAAPTGSGGDATASGTTDVAEQVQQAVNTLASERAVAVAGKDKAGWLGTLADPSSAYGTAQAGLFDRLVALPVTGLTPREVAVAPASAAATSTSTSPDASATAPAGDPAPAGAWVANLRLAYRFDGYDQGDRSFTVSYLVTRAGDGWRLYGVGPGRTDVQPFDLANATSVRSAATLVVGDVPEATLQTYLSLGDTARERIEKAWGSARPSVIVAPKDDDEFQAQLGRGSIQGLDQIAAITDGPVTAGEPAPSDRVYLNPGAFARLSPNGRSVVLTHELTHVTIRGSTTRRVPIWLSEGYADEVAFASSGLPQKTVAADLLGQIRSGDVPATLPDTGDFDPSRGVISPTYNAAWLAVVLLRQTYGQVKLNGFYRAIAGGATPDSTTAPPQDELTQKAFVEVFGLTQDAFVVDWRAFLVKLAA